ncbi:hypothetical protein MIMGU_mgv11b021825mg [Erythranthe guttata]|uniref:RING-type domain-containing protein n=1 Tax=Erythranthe guttata TaxID=4155 RepID=A0A022RKS7_ERYGU|nr:hypothetical protein MIMGU_mgv11b021825mg [Erythranthe guttata]
MIERAMEEATWLVKSRPPDHNYVSVDLCMRVGLVFDFDKTMMPIFDDVLCGKFAKHAVVAVVAETCTICLIDFSDDDGRGGLKSVYTPCGHKFHRHCINEWLKSRARTRSWRPITPFCPICRCNIEARAL